MTTPAERYAAARNRQARARSQLGAFAATLDFPLDDFQERACRAVEAGRGVLVAAPTGAGKTVVGEFAVHLALERGQKAFYTTPIKALSNQKYHDLVARHGSASVGLLTGDSTVNGEAPVVVMTTEVLRNMMYAGSRTLEGLAFVVMDEVHYLADRFRGAVWEEVIIHLPESVQLVSLSATVSNAEEFGDWLTEVRGNHEVIVSEHRPVPLWQHMQVAAHPGSTPTSSRPSGRSPAGRVAATGGGGGGPGHRTGTGAVAAGAEATAVTGQLGREVGPGAVRPGRRSSPAWSGTASCRRSRSSSAGPAARPPSASSSRPTCDSSPTRRGGGCAASSRRGSASSRTRTCPSSATGTSSRA
jgi:ATP-dependent RNA helicase HelY